MGTVHVAHHPDQQSGEQQRAHNHPGGVTARIAGIEVPQAVAGFSRFAGDAVHRAVDLASSTTCHRKFVEIHTSGRTIALA